MESALIIYFSRAGENYVSGTLQYLKKGNTEIAAETIQKLTGGKLFKVQPVVPYAEDYNTCIEEARQDQKKDARPGIAAMPDHLEQYDVIYLGYPVWWGTNPRIIQTVLDKYDISNSKIYTFCTSGGSGIESSISDLQTMYSNLNIVAGKRFDNPTEEDVKAWLESIG